MNQVANIFKAQTAQKVTSTSVLANTDQQRAIAEVQSAMVVARANPRNEIEAMDKILNACSRVTLAESAVYQYARGGSNISGASIRLAEALAQYWGNIQYGIRELEQANGSSTVQAYAWDVENNVRREMTFQVEHIRHTKNGSYPLKDPRDIYEHIANNGARRLRACILAVIPSDVADSAVQQCERTLSANVDLSKDTIKKLVGIFKEFGVTQAMIEKKIQRRIDAIQPGHVLTLRKIYMSLRDNMSTVADWFEVEAEVNEPVQEKFEAKGTAGLKAKLAKQAKEQEQAQELELEQEQA